MNQSQSIAAIATVAEISPKDVKSLFAAIAAVALDTVKNQDVLILPGIGRLRASHRPARQGRNPATGASIKIPAKDVVKFAVAKALKVAVAESGKKKKKPSSK